MNAEQLDPTPLPPRSHLSLFCEVQELARHIVDLTAAVPMECQPQATVNRHVYFTVAYRWGHTNEHWYFVYVGPDQVRAVTLAEAEANERGGKYGCAVYEFDERGQDYQMVYYSPSMTEDTSATEPTHNARLDYLVGLGLVLESACDGFLYVPVEGQSGLKHTLVDVPEVLKDERLRLLERFHKVLVAEPKFAHEPPVTPLP